MKKLLSILLTACSITAHAAGDNGLVTSASATQTIQVELTDQIEIGFVNTSGTVNLAFANVGNYTSGVESTDQQIRVRSNRKFEVKMQANAEYFTYSGAATTAPTMKVKDVLALKVSGNATGGQVNSHYAQYGNVNGVTNDQVLNGCNNGEDQTFSVRYRATPGFQYPAGNYTIEMVYTATQS